MSVVLHDDQQLLVDTLRDMVLTAHPDDAAIATAEDPFAFDDAKLWDLLVQIGAPGLAVPVEAGGAGGTTLDLTLAIEVCGYGLLPGGFLASAGIATPLLMAAPTGPSPTRDMLTQTAEGTRRLTAALDASVAIDEDGDTLVLHGTAPLVLEAGAADMILVATDAAIVAVPLDMPGVIATPAPTYDVSRRFYDVELDHVRVPQADCVVGGPAAATAVRIARDHATLAVAADALGSAQRALDDAVAYARTREQFGRPIGSFQAIKHLLVDTHVAVDAARSATWYAARALDTDPPDRELALHAAKALATDAAILAAANAVQVHGGVGFTREVTCHLHVKRARLNERLLGSAAEHRRAIAASIRTGLPEGW